MNSTRSGQRERASPLRRLRARGGVGRLRPPRPSKGWTREGFRGEFARRLSGLAGVAGAGVRSAWAQAAWRTRSPRLPILKSALGAVLAYVAAGPLPGEAPVLAPLTALLVIQSTLYETLTSGLQRVASVVAGVLLAVLLSTVFGLTWWSLGLVVLASLLIGQRLRLGSQLWRSRSAPCSCWRWASTRRSPP